MKICAYCESENDDSAKICTACGASAFKCRCNNCGAIFESAFCPICGTKAGAQAKVCPQCGERYFTPACPKCGYNSILNRAQQQVETKPQRIVIEHVTRAEETPKKKVSFGKILLWIVFFPIMLFFAMWKSKTFPAKWKLLVTIAIAAVIFWYFPGKGSYRNMISTFQNTVSQFVDKSMRGVVFPETSQGTTMKTEAPKTKTAVSSMAPQTTAMKTASPVKQGPKSTQSATNVPKSTNFPSQSLKEIMDGYEAFVDSYCTFMKKYNESTDVSSMTLEYLGILSKFYEWESKIDDIDEDDLSEADFLYYSEVMLRCANKLLQATAN